MWRFGEGDVPVFAIASVTLSLLSYAKAIYDVFVEHVPLWRRGSEKALLLFVGALVLFAVFAARPSLLSSPVHHGQCLRYASSCSPGARGTMRPCCTGPHSAWSGELGLQTLRA